MAKEIELLKLKLGHNFYWSPNNETIEEISFNKDKEQFEKRIYEVNKLKAVGIEKEFTDFKVQKISQLEKIDNIESLDFSQYWISTYDKSIQKVLKTFNLFKHKYSIPVEWIVWDRIEIQADTLEEAIRYFQERKDYIPLGTEGEYIEGTFKISGDDESFDIDDIVRNLKEYWNFNDALETNIEENEEATK